ncbi:hypothetical protein C496_08014 [Natronorubrum tibetense GA33]|uniref:Uncharacterized protein n=1 Tax=Natronorubrum tibetense GA33 TaxID=1114856 RepID=L9W0Z5_9EURY|nr:hypothetical protein C496_08014 [Natronorubrum tibetense GA33]
MPSRLSRQSLSTHAGWIGLAGCLDTLPTDGNDDTGNETDSEDESDAQDIGVDDSVGFDAYDFEVDVPRNNAERHSGNVLEGVEMVYESEKGDTDSNSSIGIRSR